MNLRLLLLLRFVVVVAVFLPARVQLSAVPSLGSYFAVCDRFVEAEQSKQSGREAAAVERGGRLRTREM
ncbi:unnamed protein product [Jaminaea pallidilutea]